MFSFSLHSLQRSTILFRFSERKEQHSISTQVGQGERQQSVTFLFNRKKIGIVTASSVSELYLGSKITLSGSLEVEGEGASVCVCVCVFCLSGRSSSNHKTHPRETATLFSHSNSGRDWWQDERHDFCFSTHTLHKNILHIRACVYERAVRDRGDVSERLKTF